MMAPRAAIDPIDIAECLPFISLFRFDRDRKDFVCTLSGEENSAAWGGASLVGRRHADFLDCASADAFLLRAQIMMETPALAIGSSVLARKGEPDRRRRVRRLSLPLADSEGSPWGLISISNFGPAAPMKGTMAPAPSETVMFDCRVLPRDDP